MIKKTFWSQGDELIWVILPIKSKIFGTTLNLNTISVNLQAHSAFNPQFCIISHIKKHLMIMRITMNCPLKVTSTQLLISKAIELFLKILSLGEDRNALLPFSPCHQQGKLQFRSCLPLSSSRCPASQHRHRYQR